MYPLNVFEVGGIIKIVHKITKGLTNVLIWPGHSIVVLELDLHFQVWKEGSYNSNVNNIWDNLLYKKNHVLVSSEKQKENDIYSTLLKCPG